MTVLVLPRRRQAAVQSSVLAMLVLAGAEVMFFAGLISAFTIARAGARPDQWTLPTEPLLPAAATALNTAALAMSGLLTYVANRRFQRGTPGASRTLAIAWLFGAAFVVLQGREWIGLVQEGMTVRSSALGSFFYLIVGAHGVHAVAALGALGLAWWRIQQGRPARSLFLGAQTFWYFVVGLWPIIYGIVYF